MKGFAVIFVCAVLVAVIWARPDDKYTDQYDNVDVDEILTSDRLLDNYFSCLKTGKKCTADGQKLREILPDALKTKCKKCTETQSTQSKKVLQFLAKNKPQMFKELEQQFDPNREYRKAYADELKADGIILPD